MVVNISQVLSGRWDDVRSDIRAVTEATHAAGRKIKVIFETCYLDEAQKISLCEICGDLGVDWVKTSTGYGTSGATLEDVALMRKHSPPHVQVKAAGSIRDLDTLLAMRQLGATRCGASRTQEILDEANRRLGRPAVQTVRAASVAGY
jgi:deoxyribose-phosphate aldolase